MVELSPEHALGVPRGTMRQVAWERPPAISQSDNQPPLPSDLSIENDLYILLYVID